MRGEGSGCVAGGCGGFSLLGLLIGVGLTVWLASMVVDGTGPATQGGQERSGSGGVTTTAPSRDPVGTTAPVTVSPREDLADGASVTVTSDAFPPDTEVTVTTCLDGAGADRVSGGQPCDPATAATFRTDARGHLVAPYRPSRLVTTSGLPFDCASAAGRCRVQATSTTDPGLAGAVAISFAPGLGSPEITLPGG